MDTVSVTNDGCNQTISIPEGYRFNESELYINKIGGVIMLVPKNDPWTEVFKGLNMFTDDFMEDGRGNLHYENRVTL